VQRSTVTFLQIRLPLRVCAPNSTLKSCVITNALLQLAGETDLCCVQCDNSKDVREDHILVSDVFECIHLRVRVTQWQDELDSILTFEVHETVLHINDPSDENRHINDPSDGNSQSSSQMSHSNWQGTYSRDRRRSVVTNHRPIPPVNTYFFDISGGGGGSDSGGGDSQSTDASFVTLPAIVDVVVPTPRENKNFDEGLDSETLLLNIPLDKLGTLIGLQNSLTFVPYNLEKKWNCVVNKYSAYIRDEPKELVKWIFFLLTNDKMCEYTERYPENCNSRKT